MSYQLTAIVLSSYDKTVTKTPRIDTLAAQDTVLENDCCNYLIYVLSYFAIMSAHLPSKISAFKEFPATVPTTAHYPA